MPALSRRNRRPRRKAGGLVDASANSRAASHFEFLEPRVFLCADSAALVASGIPAAMVRSDGHITWANFTRLTDAQRAHVDPHMVEAPSDQPMDFDRILGIPLSVLNPPGESVPTDVLPDFFPQLDSAISIDQTSQSGRTLLRFGTQVNNQGLGPGILISGRPGVDPIPTGAPITSWVNPDGSQNVIQAVYSYDPARPSGSQFQLSRYLPGGRFTYHSGHGHFHFDGYAQYRLRHNTGGVPGSYVVRGDGTGVVGTKTGFCLINTSSSFTMENGQSSTTLPGYSASSPYNGQPSTGCGLLQGVRVGQADEYSSGLEGQWIDVTGVANGSYFVELTLDGENGVQESNENNNSKSWGYTLNTSPPPGGITPDVFDANGENNNSFGEAADLGAMGTMSQTGLTVHWGQDYDYFRFTATSTGTYTVSTTAANGNVDLYLFDVAQSQIGSSTNASGTDTVSYSFVKGQTYYSMAVTYNSTTSSNYQMAWTIKPTVDATMPARTVLEENSAGSYFTIMRNGPTLSALVVPLTIGGNAVSGVDYQALPTSVTFDALTSEIQIPLIPINNGSIDNRRTVTLTANTNSAYVVGTAAAITIIDQDGGSGRSAGFGGAVGEASEAPALLTSRHTGNEVSSLFNSQGSLLNLLDGDTQRIALDELLA